jgi:hypothetical protein
MFLSFEGEDMKKWFCVILIILSVLIQELVPEIGEPVQAAPARDVYYVSPDGSNVNDGSAESPWRTIDYAASQLVPEGGTVVVADGTYTQDIFINDAYENSLHFVAEHPYRAKIQSDRTNGVIELFTLADNVIFEGFEITRGSSEKDFAIYIHGSNITFRNNIIHDVRANDLIKIGGRDQHNVIIEGNMFYNQGPGDEHIDVNTNSNQIFIQDNIFFSDFASSGRSLLESYSFIVIKDSGEAQNTRYIHVRRNVFLNWEGNHKDFILVGEDGKPTFEARDVTIENNLMIGNSPHEMQAPIGVRGSKDITVRANTIVGDLPALNYGIVSYIVGDNPPNENVRIHNNIWSDPTGTMGVNFSCCGASQTKSYSFDNNLFFNGGEPFPISKYPFVEIEDDAHRVEGDPKLGDQGDGIILPRWNGNGFNGGYLTIREAFEDLVARYGAPGPGSAVIDAADPLHTPVDDILGRRRSDIDDTPDIGAYEAGSIEFDLTVDPYFHAISPMSSITYALSLEANFFRGPVSITVGGVPEGVVFNLDPMVISAPGDAVLSVTSTSALSDTFGVYMRMPITATGGGQVRSSDVGLLVGGGGFFLPLIMKSVKITRFCMPIILVKGRDMMPIYLPLVFKE